LGDVTPYALSGLRVITLLAGPAAAMSNQDAGDAEQEDGNFLTAKNAGRRLCRGNVGGEGWRRHREGECCK